MNCVPPWLGFVGMFTAFLIGMMSGYSAGYSEHGRIWREKEMESIRGMLRILRRGK